MLLHLALARPELLRSIVLISGNYHHDALHPEVIAMLNGVVANEPFAAAFAERSPDGAAHWPVVVEKGLKMGAREEPTFTPADLRRITTPTLVIAGDDDMFSVAHTASMYDALPDAQLAIIPGSSHWVVAEKTALVAEMIQAFLESPGRPATMVPVKRRPS